jgi:hypothetical protein
MFSDQEEEKFYKFQTSELTSIEGQAFKDEVFKK